MDSLSNAAALPLPTGDERNMATLAQALPIVCGWLAPLIIYLVRRESKFVSFHAMQALLWQAIVFLFWMVVSVGWVGVVFSMMFAHGHPEPPNAPPVKMLIAFGAIALVALSITAINLFLGIFYGIKANEGKWAEYPVIGKWARRIVGI